MTIDSNLIELIKAIIWPIIILLILGILIIFPKSIKPVVYIISRVTSKLSFGGLTIEFAKVEEFKSSLGQIFSEIDSLKFISGALVDLSRPVATSDPSVLVDLSRLIKEDSAADYFVINLENGDKWITSRLYIFSIILQMRGLKCFVFVETNQNITNRFVGTAEIDKVRWALAKKYPWLEKAFNKAIWNFDITALNGAINENQIGQLVNTFIESIRYTKEFVKKEEFEAIHGISTPDSNPKEWISISEYTIKKEPVGSGRLFNWSNVPGIDTNSLIGYLNHIININWDAKITKTNNTIQIISYNHDLVEITLDEKSKTAMLQINNGQIYTLLADDKRNIYKNTFERARWLRSSINIEHLLGKFLNKAAMIDSPNISEDEKEKFVLSKDVTFVAILNNDNSFDRLIDRSKFVEKIAKSFIRYF